MGRNEVFEANRNRVSHESWKKIILYYSHTNNKSLFQFVYTRKLIVSLTLKTSNFSPSFIRPIYRPTRTKGTQQEQTFYLFS